MQTVNCIRNFIIRLTVIPIFLQLGYPLPKLVWYTTSDNEQQGGSNPVIIADSSYDTMGGSTRNTLSIPRLQRSHFGQTFACIATNNNVTDHVATNVTIDMRRKLLHFYDIRPFLGLRFGHFGYFGHFIQTFTCLVINNVTELKQVATNMRCKYLILHSIRPFLGLLRRPF